MTSRSGNNSKRDHRPVAGHFAAEGEAVEQELLSSILEEEITATLSGASAIDPDNVDRPIFAPPVDPRRSYSADDPEALA
ncbi:unnamed protein product, partial [Amoebophrya sp. A120]|eukprot:GSA120T00009932001.1